MEFQFNEEQREIWNSFSKILKGLIIKVNHDSREENFEKGQSILRELATFGCFGLAIPEEYEGAGLEPVSAAITINLMARVEASLAHILLGQNYCFCKPILDFGTDEQKGKYLKQAARGEIKTALAVTEPDGNSLDVMKLTARRNGDYFALNGTKSMISNAGYADYALVFARTEFGPDEFENWSFFIVELKNNDGIHIGKNEKTMGFELCPIAEINFNDCKVPADQILGGEGKGILVLVKMMEFSRLFNAAIALGIAEAAYDEALKFARSRILEGKPMVEHPAILTKLGSIFTDLKVMKLLTYQTANLIGTAFENKLLAASVTKLIVTEKAKEICDKALQIHGGSGYIKEYPIEKLYRDVRINTILGGTSESIQSYVGEFILGRMPG